MNNASEEAVVLAKITLKWGGKEITIDEKPLEDNVLFREAIGRTLAGSAKSIAPLLSPFLAMKFREGAGEQANIKKAMKKIEDLDLAELLEKILPDLLGSSCDQLIECLYLYAPELKEREKEASFEEKIEAGFVILGVAFPLVKSVVMGIASLLSRV